MERNEFKLLGRVSELSTECKSSGLVVSNIKIGVSTGKKNDEGKTIYDNYFITFFRETAEKIIEEVQQGDYIQVTGSLSMNKYTPSEGEKTRYSIKLIGWGYKKVTFDKEQNKFIEVI